MKMKNHAIWKHLGADEILEEKINKRPGIQFRNEDYLHFLLIIFGSFLLIQILPAFLKGNKDLHWLFFVCSLMIIKPVYSFVKRWIKNKRSEYLITNERLIIYNKAKNQIFKSFHFNNFPRMALRENAYNSGFIILAEYDKLWESNPNEKFDWRDVILRKNYIDMKDYKYTLDNIPEVKKVYNKLLRKIDTKAKSR